MRTSSRSTARPARCCGKPRWPTGARTTTPPARRCVVGTSSISGSRAETKACAASWPRSIRRRARKCGGSGPCQRRASLAPRPGRAAASSIRERATWLTGTYDPELDTLYWPTGNPAPDLYGDDREGDNLYSDSILALDPKTGKLKWHFQFTPHDVWDYDAQETPALIDANWQGKPRKLLVQANRNGFFYVLDRTDGKFLLGTQVREERHVGDRPHRRRTADSRARYGADARRPARLPVARRRVELVFDVVQSGDRPLLRADQRQVRRLHEDPDGVGSRHAATWAARSCRRPTSRRRRVLRAIDIQTGKSHGKLPQVGPGDSWGGMLSTASGVVFFGEDSGSFMAVDAANGKPLVELPDEPELEGVADDLRVRQQAVRRGRRRVGHYCVRVAGLIRVRRP